MNHAILWQSPPKWKNENQDVWVSAFQNANCNATYLFWESPCRNLIFIWHFEMLIKCNANISILGAMQNANVMQMKCNTNKCEKMHNSGSNQIQLFPTAPNLVFVANFGVDFADSYHLTNPSYPFQV